MSLLLSTAGSVLRKGTQAGLRHASTLLSRSTPSRCLPPRLPVMHNVPARASHTSASAIGSAATASLAWTGARGFLQRLVGQTFLSKVAILTGGVSSLALISYRQLRPLSVFADEVLIESEIFQQLSEADDLLVPMLETDQVVAVQEERSDLAQGYKHCSSGSIWEKLGDVVRWFEICLRVTPLVLFYPLAWSVSALKPLWYDLLLLTFEDLGPCFIKFGQWIATRPDVFEEDLCECLGRLHLKAPGHSANTTRRVIEQAFRRPLDDVFVEFDDVPIASGSIAQVHRAVVCDDHGKRRVVAVKVQHPGVAKQMDQDIRILQVLCTLLQGHANLEHVDMNTAFKEFKYRMMTQVDLLKEAEHLVRFRKNFKAYEPVISFPEPALHLCRPTVLVESFEHGEMLTSFLGKNDRGSERFRHKLASVGMTAFLKMILVDNFTHADMHPGNIMVTTVEGGQAGHDFSDETTPKLVILDVGIVTELSQSDKRNFMDMFTALVSGESQKAASLFIERAQSIDPPSTESIDAFRNGMARVLNEALDSPLHDMDVGQVVRDMLSLSRENGVPLDTACVSLVMSVAVIEGIARQLSDDFNILDEARPLLKSNHELVVAYLKQRMFVHKAREFAAQHPEVANATAQPRATSDLSQLSLRSPTRAR